MAMKRKNVVYGYIPNDTARKASLKKRRPGFLKKVKELSILCGIKACGIVYSPNEEEPECWPEQTEVEAMLRVYEAIPEMEKSWKRINQESYMKDRVKKLEEHLKSLETGNREMEMKQFLHQIYRGGKTLKEFMPMQVEHLTGFVEEKGRLVDRRQHFLRGGNYEPAAPPPPLEMSLSPLSLEDEETITFGEEDPSEMEEWFLNMTKESQYDVGSSSATAVKKQKAVHEEYAAVFENNNVGGGGSDIYDIIGHPHDQNQTILGPNNPGEIGDGNGTLLPPGNGGGANGGLGGRQLDYWANPISTTQGNNNWVNNMNNLHDQKNAAVFPRGVAQGSATLYGLNLPDWNGAGGFNNAGHGISCAFGMKPNIWNNIGGTSSGYGCNVPIPCGNQGSVNVVNHPPGYSFGDIGSGSVGHGWRLNHGQVGGTNDPYGMHQGGQVGGTNTRQLEVGTMHFPGEEAIGNNNDMFGAIMPSSSLIDHVIQPHVPPPTYYDVGGSNVENGAQLPGDYLDWPNMYP